MQPIAEPIVVMDDTGKVEEWLTSGRGVHVWRNQDLSSPRIGGLMFTPGDGQPVAPHWAYAFERTVLHQQGMVFFRKSHVVRRYSSSPAGRKAAGRLADQLGAPERVAPIGRVLERHNVEELAYRTTEEVVAPLAPHPTSSRPLDTVYYCCVVAWSALIPV